MARRLLARLAARLRRAREDHTEFMRTGDTVPGIRDEYHEVLNEELRRWGIPEECASLEIRHVRDGAHGMAAFAGVITLQAWDRAPALRLLLGFPLLERRFRHVIGSRWLGHVSEFEGLWLRTSEQLQQAPAPRELRELLVGLTGWAGHEPPPRAAEDTAAGGVE